MKAEDAFRIADADFDGFLNKKDLENLLIKVLKVRREDVTSPRIDRLFKIMDVFKRDAIQITEFKRVLEDETPENTGRSTDRSGRFSARDPPKLDWKRHSKQQIGLFISKQYPSLHESFESKHSIYKEDFPLTNFSFF